MIESSKTKIALVGAAGMSFGPVMVLDAVRAKKIEGATLVLMDINSERLEFCYTAAQRLNESMKNPINIEQTTDIAQALDGAQFVLLSVENKRFHFWKQDYEIPRKYGSTQIMGENGGPGGLFHSLRSINLVLSICRDMEKYSPDALLINLTNPMSRICLAVSRYTKLKNVGLCHELYGGMLRISTMLLIPMHKIAAEASGINHFTWFYKMENQDTGEDLYPKLKRHAKLLPLLYPPLLRHTFSKYGLLATSTDSHIGEYLPYAQKVNWLGFPYHAFFHNEWKLRNFITETYAKGYIPLNPRFLKESGELAFPIIEAIVSGEQTYLGAVNVPNKGYIPNLPDGSIVEVHANVDGNGIEPLPTPPIKEELAELMRIQIDLQSMIADAAYNGDKDLAFKALVQDTLSPKSEFKCRKMFEEMHKLQKEYLPF